LLTFEDTLEETSSEAASEVEGLLGITGFDNSVPELGLRSECMAASTKVVGNSLYILRGLDGVQGRTSCRNKRAQIA